MIEGFDKEIDSLLRRTAKGETVQQTTFDAHLDADEISLFAENALTTKARTHAAGHLAECTKCRKILSHLISFNAESESEIIHGAGAASDIIPATAAAASTPATPWYRRLFAFPQITFAMGALVLVFSGIIAFLVMQGASDTERNTAIAQREEIRETSRGGGGGGVASDGETRTVETYSTSNTSNAASVNPTSVDSNTSMNSAANSTSVNTSSTAGNVAALPGARTQPQAGTSAPVSSTKQENNTLTPAENQDALTAAPQNKPSVAANVPAPKTVDEQQRKVAKDAAEESPERKRIDLDDRNNESQVTVTGSTTSPASRSKKSAAVGKNKDSETRTVSGKTFRSVGGVWFDAAYRSQPQIMIRRGSDDYKRLDSGLRSIAESLSGTSVVVWKGKAYRIN